MRNPWIQWNVLSPREIDHPSYDDIKEANSAALSCLGMETGLTHLEWFRREDGTVAINEVAARPPGAQIVTLMNRAHDIDLFSIWVKMMVWNTLDPIPERKYATGAVFLRGLGGNAVHSVEGMEVLEAHEDLITDLSLPELGQPASNNYEGEGYVLIRHQETERVRQALDSITSQVRVRMF
jgi:formate-dependent phosphoribosylglycinamide formyltransferase (GAR transformylase)